MTTLLVVDDDADVRSAISALIRRQPGLSLVGAAASHDEALELARTAAPEVVVMDVKMSPGGATATRAILRVVPDAKVVAFSAHDDRGALLEMVDAGAVGYVVKGCSAGELLAAVEAAVRGQVSLSAGPSATLLQELSTRLGLERRDRQRQQDREQMVRLALSTLHMVFQPIVDLRDGDVVGVEALSRFHDLEDNSPATVYDAARRTSLGPTLEAAAVREALRHLPSFPPGTFLSVNISPDTLLSDALADVQAQPLRAVVVEITEHAPVEDYAVLAHALAPWRAHGARVAVDDAGAGFASLRHILKLAPDFIKLDASLTAGLAPGTADHALAAALVTFARETGAEIIAEGIERADQVDVLSALGVRLGQGYRLGRPRPAAHTPGDADTGAPTHSVHTHYASGTTTTRERAAGVQSPTQRYDPD